MKIALLHDSILPPKNYGGIERIVITLAREYTRLGHQVIVLSQKGSRLGELDFNCEAFALPENYESIAPQNWMPKDIDFLHSHQPLPLKPQIPFLVTSHGNGFANEKYWRNTNFLSQSHCRNHNGRYYVYNGVDPTAYPVVEKKDDYFVFLARTTWRVKNLKTAIAWAKDLNVELRIMGGNGVSRGNIQYAGLVNESKKIELLSHARALIYPTNWDEPCAGAPLEALACGTPVISSANGCMPELVRKGTGFVCETYEDLLHAGQQVGSLQPRDCRKSIDEFFSLKRMAADYLALFDKIMKTGELDHEPRFNFDEDSVTFLYKPTLRNKLRLAVLGKI